MVSNRKSSLNPVALGMLGLALVCTIALPAPAQTKGKAFDALSLPSTNFALPGMPDAKVEFSAQYELENGSKNGRLTVTAKIADGWHIFSLTQPAGGPKPSKFKLKSEFLKLTGPFSADHAPEIGSAEEVWPGLPLEEYHEKVVWTAPFELISDIDPSKTEIEVAFDGQACMESCVEVKETFSAKFAGNYGSAEKSTSIKPKNTHATWSATLTPSKLKPGQSGKITLKAVPDPKYHVYTFINDTKSTDFRTLIVPSIKSELEVGLPVSYSNKEQTDVGGDAPVEYHVGEVEWTIPIKVPMKTELGQRPIEIMIGFLTCDDKSCDAPAGLSLNGTVEVAEEASSETVQMTVATTPYRVVAEKWETATFGSPAATAPTLSLTPWYLFAALLGGFILNFMPCVLPVVGLKLMSFVNQAGSSRTRIISLNLAFVAGIISVMLVLATVTIAAKTFYGQAFGWGQQFERLDFQVGLAMLVFAMALSFLGVWEIPIPGFATSSHSGELMQKEGHLGAYLKGILTTVLATPCSGPFLGAVFGITLSLSPVSIVILYVTLGIGLGFPYLALCAYPGFVKYLPKPGAWMETLKQVLAFPLLLTVVYMIQIVSPDYRIATLILLIVVWFACWLIGRVPPYSETKQIRNAWAIGLGTISVGAIVSFTVFGPIKHLLPWEPYNEAQLAEYRREGKTVMVEFTARWCLTCQANMRYAIDREKVRDVCKENNVITMLADKSEPSPAIDKKLQELGSNSIPLLAIYPPDAEPIVLRDTISQSQLIEALKQAGPSKQLAWQAYEESALADLRKQGKTVMVQFSANWDKSSQAPMEVFAAGKVIRLCRENDVVTMLADKSKDSPAIDKLLSELGSTKVPLLAIFPPNGSPIVLSDTLKEAQLVAALEQAGPSRVKVGTVVHAVSTAVR